MLGISGGGWTTVLFSAIDDKISQNYSVVGSFPMFMRSDSKNIGDYEQIIPELYSIANYLDLYILASFGDDRKHIQIFNKNDPCCFSGDLRGIFDNDIQVNLQELGMGHYEIFIDETHFEHKISEYSLKIIQNEIKDT